MAIYHPPTGLEGAKRSKTSSDDSNPMRGTVRTRNNDEIGGETKKQKIRCLNLCRDVVGKLVENCRAFEVTLRVCKLSLNCLWAGRNNN